MRSDRKAALLNIGVELVGSGSTASSNVGVVPLLVSTGKMNFSRFQPGGQQDLSVAKAPVSFRTSLSCVGRALQLAVRPDPYKKLFL